MHIPYVCVPWAQHLISLEIQNLPTTPFCWCAPTSPMKSQHSMFRSVAARLSGAHPARVERLSALRCVQTPIEAMLPHIHIPREHGRFLLHYGECGARSRRRRCSPRQCWDASPGLPSRSPTGPGGRSSLEPRERRWASNSPTPLPTGTMNLFTLATIFPVGSQPVRAVISPAPGPPPRHMRV